MKYKCISRGNTFPVRKWFNYILGKINAFGLRQFECNLYCDNCWENKKSQRGMTQEKPQEEPQEDEE